MILREGVLTVPNPNEVITDNTVGELQPNSEAMMVNEKGEPLGTRQTGEIWIRAPFITTGYYNDPEQTARVLT